MKEEDLIGKKVILRNVSEIEVNEGLVAEKTKDITGILEKIGSNKFFGWALSVVIDGKAYQIKRLSQIEVIS